MSCNDIIRDYNVTTTAKEVVENVSQFNKLSTATGDVKFTDDDISLTF